MEMTVQSKRKANASLSQGYQSDSGELTNWKEKGGEETRGEAGKLENNVTQIVNEPENEQQ